MALSLSSSAFAGLGLPFQRLGESDVSHLTRCLSAILDASVWDLLHPDTQGKPKRISRATDAQLNRYLNSPDAIRDSKEGAQKWLVAQLEKHSADSLQPTDIAITMENQIVRTTKREVRYLMQRRITVDFLLVPGVLVPVQHYKVTGWLCSDIPDPADTSKSSYVVLEDNWALQTN